MPVNERAFLDVISGRARGVGAALLRGLLEPAGWAFGVAATLRKWLYDARLLPVQRVDVPVICVGNLTAGGTGKTPAVALLVRMLRERGRVPAIVSRGYRARHGANDEHALLQELLGEVIHVQHPDRVRAAREAVAQGADVTVLDDGFSHRRLARDLDLLLIDALEPFGFNRFLPRGLLREPLSALRRAGAVIFTRADLATPERLHDLEDVVRCYGFNGPMLQAAHRPAALVSLAGVSRGLESLRGARVATFCGIGQPGGFVRGLEALGAVLTVEPLLLADHADYDAVDNARRLEVFLKDAAALGCELAVCTQKDAVKLRGQSFALPVFELRVEFELLHDAQRLAALIQAVLDPPASVAS